MHRYKTYIHGHAQTFACTCTHKFFHLLYSLDLVFIILFIIIRKDNTTHCVLIYFLVQNYSMWFGNIIFLQRSLKFLYLSQIFVVSRTSKKTWILLSVDGEKAQNSKGRWQEGFYQLNVGFLPHCITVFKEGMQNPLSYQIVPRR